MLRMDDYNFARLRQAEILKEAERARLASRAKNSDRETDRRITLRLQALFAR